MTDWWTVSCHIMLRPDDVAFPALLRIPSSSPGLGLRTIQVRALAFLRLLAAAFL
jgi:hypothetical protein